MPLHVLSESYHFLSRQLTSYQHTFSFISSPHVEHHAPHQTSHHLPLPKHHPGAPNPSPPLSNRQATLQLQRPPPPLPSAHKQHSPVPYGRSTNPPSRPSLPPRSIPSHISNQIPIREAQMLHSHLPRRQQITITILHPSPYSSHTA
jgi:hypothetical protein